ncbi:MULTISPECIES: molybdate ABC transporter substrate-binding protein [Bradyrhizobium]|uniref:molybdate ABC transporter substrate-binding protein n=1 Tax=Bradyrhizobium TaxID=374 RepID=UPI001EDBBA01|nr:substrate-binding domain-containing protein [Bradyrhizobium zhengyangense]MCG2644029.1 substrate-binding domain-containing protein [Bradyrhizobium zhengyangense]
MTVLSFARAAFLASVFVTFLSEKGQAAELRVLAGGAMTAVWAEVKPKFEQVSGHKLDIFFGTTPNLIKEATSGKAFDVGVVPVEVMQDAGARAKFAAGTTSDVARVGLGVAVRAGAPKPNIGTPDAFKAALLDARSIATLPASAAGAQVMKAFERLGVAVAIKGKLQAKAAPAEIVAAVEKGEAELGVFLLNVLTAPGLDVVGPFPADLQQEVVFTGAAAADTKQGDAAKALLGYLKSPEASAIIKAKGMTPG